MGREDLKMLINLQVFGNLSIIWLDKINKLNNKVWEKFKNWNL